MNESIGGDWIEEEGIMDGLLVLGQEKAAVVMRMTISGVRDDEGTKN